MSEPTIEAEPRQCWIAGVAERGERSLTVRHPFDDTDVADVTVPSAEQIERAIAGAAAVAGAFRNSPAAQRARSLHRVADLLVRRGEEIAETITAESGKPWHWAELEVAHTVGVFRAAAAATAEFTGELGSAGRQPGTDSVVRLAGGQPGGTAGSPIRYAGEPPSGMTGSPVPFAGGQSWGGPESWARLAGGPPGRGTDSPVRLAGTRRRARGPVLAIGSSTFPLAGVARQVAPALAVGAPVLSKPASLTPLSALLLGEILAEADFPSGTFSVLPLRGKNMTDLVQDPRLPVIAVTGSRDTGAAVRAAVPDKHVVLELGGTTTAIVCPDLASELALTEAAEQIALAANAQAGQSRLAVRRVLVHQDVAATFQSALLGAVRALATGSPHDPEVAVGPLVSEEAAILATQWVDDAIAAGATLLTGGVRDRASLVPTVLLSEPEVRYEEVLAPVIVLSTVDNTRRAFGAANAVSSGLPVGVLTHDVRAGLLAASELDDDVIVGALPSDAFDDIADIVAAYTRPQSFVLSGGLAD